MRTLKGLLLVVALMSVSFAQGQTSLAQLASSAVVLEAKPTTHSGAVVISTYQEGLAITKLEDKYGLVNKQGLEVCLPQFQNIHLFENGYAAVQKHNKWTFINKQGKKLTTFRYDWVGNFKNQVAPVQIDGKWGYINEQGFEIAEVKYEVVQPFENGKALVKYNNQWFYLDEVTGTESPAPKTVNVDTDAASVAKL
ncbi:MAG: WG repeat-containing protein [Aureispira sp.]|nr:WG repeat-containing protein [Aureispira sp.]